MSTSFITPGHVRAFQAVTTQRYGEVTLASCLINGKPGVAIVLVDNVGEGKLAVMPLFVAITPEMDIAFEGEVGGGSGEGGGPRSGFKDAQEVSFTSYDFSVHAAPAEKPAGALSVIGGPLTDEDPARPSPAGYC